MNILNAYEPIAIAFQKFCNDFVMFHYSSE